MEPLPNVKIAFSILSREESHQKNEYLNFSSTSKNTQVPVLNIRDNNFKKNQNQNRSRNHGL